MGEATPEVGKKEVATGSMTVGGIGGWGGKEKE